MKTTEQQLADIYRIVDRLQEVEQELRAGIDDAIATLKGESPDHD